MREIVKIKYETIIESDVSDDLIYAFVDGKDSIAVLSRKDNQFYWSSLSSTKMVWYKMYDSIEEAIEGVIKVKEYKERKCGAIMEFSNCKQFIEWAYTKVFFI